MLHEFVATKGWDHFLGGTIPLPFLCKSWTASLHPEEKIIRRKSSAILIEKQKLCALGKKRKKHNSNNKKEKVSWRRYKTQSCALRQHSTNITADQLVLLSSLLSWNNLNKMIIFCSSVATCTLMSSTVGPMVGEEVLGGAGGGGWVVWFVSSCVSPRRHCVLWHQRISKQVSEPGQQQKWQKQIIKKSFRLAGATVTEQTLPLLGMKGIAKWRWETVKGKSTTIWHLRTHFGLVWGASQSFFFFFQAF